MFVSVYPMCVYRCVCVFVWSVYNVWCAILLYAKAKRMMTSDTQHTILYTQTHTHSPTHSQPAVMRRATMNACCIFNHIKAWLRYVIKVVLVELNGRSKRITHLLGRIGNTKNTRKKWRIEKRDATNLCVSTPLDDNKIHKRLNRVVLWAVFASLFLAKWTFYYYYIWVV